MAVSVTIMSNFAEVGMRFERAALAAPEIIAREMRITADAINEFAVPTLQAHTPVDTGRLRAETTSSVESSGMDTTIHLEQPSSVYWRRIGADYPYARFLIDGTKYISPRSYVSDALAEMEGGMRDIADERVRAAAEAVVQSI